MLTYQIRPRVFRLESGQELSFPAACEIVFHFQPLQPFGEQASGGCTIVKGAAASIIFNANSGKICIESHKPLSPLDVTIEEPNQRIVLKGSTLTIARNFESLTDLRQFLEGVYFGLPVLLNICIAESPYIEHVSGSVGGTGFRWELTGWRRPIAVTTQEFQEQHFATAWERMDVIGEQGRRRLMAALHYFHVACRLSRASCTAGEFVAEVVLNLTKCLEVIFPPSGDGKTRDAAREGLRGLGFSADEIECDFLPAMALRNMIDVGHVELGLFTTDQLRTIHAFTERAEGCFRQMLGRLLDRIARGETEIAQHELGKPKADAIALIERLKTACENRFQTDT